MDADAPLRWKRADGSVVPIERLELHELVQAQQRMLSGTWSSDAAQLMLAAIEGELRRRWQSRDRAVSAHDADPEEPTSRAA